MRAASASRHDKILRRMRRSVAEAQSLGVFATRIAEVGAEESIVIDGRRVVNFGNCSYLGLHLDERVIEGAVEATRRFGALYASSQAYAAIDLYDRVEEQMLDLTGAAAVVLAPTTTLGHLSCLPGLIGQGDAVVVDAQTHASVQLATQVLVSRGIPVQAVPHNDMEHLAGVVEALAPHHRRVWYLADGVYSMYGDTAPVGRLRELVDAYPNLHLYIDDAHGFSWTGVHGRGFVLSRMDWHERLIVALGLGKGFGTGGAVLAFGDAEQAEAVRFAGPMMFSGPIHPPTLGAISASAEIHLSPEHERLAGRLALQTDLVAHQLARYELPVVSWAQTPVWFVQVGEVPPMLQVARAVLDDGFFLNVSGFPVVPVGRAGLRFTHTVDNSPGQVEEMIGSLTYHFERIVGQVPAEIGLRELEAG